MPRAIEAIVIPAASAAVFDLVHDYARRREWDTLLRAAYLDEDACARCRRIFVRRLNKPTG
jgi:hypothetical protein